MWPCLCVVLQNGWTALIWASDKGWDIVVRDLLSAGADIEAKTNVGGEVTTWMLTWRPSRARIGNAIRGPWMARHWDAWWWPREFSSVDGGWGKLLGFTTVVLFQREPVLRRRAYHLNQLCLWDHKSSSAPSCNTGCMNCALTPSSRSLRMTIQLSSEQAPAANSGWSRSYWLTRLTSTSVTRYGMSMDR